MAGDDLESLDPAEWIGRTVDVVIDRPLGSRHPRDERCVYLVNYGFVPGTRAGDGEPVDAYVLGPDEPIHRSRAQVIAVVQRANDREDKLVTAESGRAQWSVTDIAVAIEFQERGFDSVVVTASEKLAVSALRRAAKAIVRDRLGRVLLVRYDRPASADHFWVVPGGGVAVGEEIDAALRRELKEEVGVDGADVGPCRWLCSSRYEYDGAVVHQAEWIYVVMVDAAEVDLDTPGARAEGIREVRWWTLGELAATAETVYPSALPELLLAGPVGDSFEPVPRFIQD